MIRLRTAPLAVLVVGILFGGVLVSQALGRWNTTTTRQPARFTSGAFAGQANPADIRGSYTWQDVENAFGLPAAAAAASFSLPGHAFGPADRVSALEEAYLGALPEGYEVGTDSVRLMAALYAGLPFAPGEGTLLPDAALDMLDGRPGMDAAAIGRYAVSTVATIAAAAPIPQPAGSGTGSPAGTGSGEAANASSRMVAGKTTFGDLYDWGLTEAQVAAPLGYAPGPRSQTVRDSLTAAGLEFSVYKTALQALVDAAGQ